MSSEPKFFKTPAEFRRWLEKNHATKTELIVGYYKKASGRKSMTYQESIDQALCFGWIDGVRRSIDDISYCNRFTPRTARSNWSQININRMKQLIAEGLVHPAGLAAFNRRDGASDAAYDRGRYSYEQRETAALPPEYEKQFRTKRKAWNYYQSQPPGYRKLTAFWVMSAKREDTRQRRLQQLIADSALERRIGLLTRPSELRERRGRGTDFSG